MINIGEIGSYLKFELMVLGFDMGAEGVKGFVMIFLFEMGEFMGDNHPQKRLRDFFKKVGNPNLVFGFELSSLYPRDEGVGSQSGV